MRMRSQTLDMGRERAKSTLRVSAASLCGLFCGVILSIDTAEISLEAAETLSDASTTTWEDSFQDDVSKSIGVPA